MPYSLATRLPAKDTSVVLLGGETFTAVNRRDEMLRRISEQSKRLRGSFRPNYLDVTKRGRLDSLRAMVTRGGIIPIHVLQQSGAASLSCVVHAYPAQRGSETVTVTGPGYSQAFNSTNNALSGAVTGTAPVTADFAATDNQDPQSAPGQPAPTPATTGAMGAARAIIP